MSVMLEREAEAATLAEWMRGDRGGLILIEAAAGAGKTTLLDAVLADAGSPVLRARGGELERDFAFGAVRQLLAGRLPADGPARALANPDAAVQPGFGVLEAIHAVVAGAAPVVIAVDDLHWVDEASLRALDFVARRGAGARILLLGTLRPSEPGAPLAVLDALRQAADAVIGLRPLSPAAVTALVRAVAPQADDAACAAALEVSAGNPLYLRELLRAVDASSPTEEAIATTAVPTLADRVTRRAALLAAEAPGLAAAMAVLGDGTPLATAAALAGVGVAQAATIARRLVRADVLADDDPFAFSHPLVRTSIHGELGRHERDRLHAAAADALAGDHDAVAAHLSARTPQGSTAVAERLVAAARDAHGRAAPEVAIVRLRRALEEGAPRPPRAEVLFELGRAEMAVRSPAAVATLETAYACAADADLRASIAAVLTDLLSVVGDWDRLMEIIDRERVPEPRTPAQLDLEAVAAAGRINDARRASEVTAEWGRLERLGEHPSWGGHALSEALAFGAALRGDRSAALRLAERALAGGTLLGERPAGGWAGPQLVFTLLMLDEIEWALDLGRRVAEDGRRNGAVIGVFADAAVRTFAAVRAGDLRAVESGLEDARTIAEAAGLGMWAANVVWFVLPALLERPSLAPLADTTERFPLDGAFAQSTSGAMVLETRGSLRAAAGRTEEAVADLRAVGAVWDALGAAPSFTSWRSRLALALPPERHDEAVAVAAEELERAGSDARARGVALRTLGTLTRDPDRLAQAVAALEPTGARLELALAHFAHGAALRRTNRTVAARPALREAVALADACGAPRLQARAETELRIAGGRRRREAGAGVDALTARERTVADLAARGLPTAAIARELFVTPKTVETHLSNVYAKLGIAGAGARARLAEQLGR